MLGDLIVHWADAFLDDDPARVEKYLAAFRAAGIVITAAALPFLPVERIELAYLPLVFAAAFTAVILFVLVPYHPGWLKGGYIACTLDALALSLAISVSGGDQSAFFVIYYPLAALYALRFGRRQIIYFPAIAATAYFAGILMSGRVMQTEWGLFAFRVYWMLGTGIIAGVLAERAENAETALRSELRRTQALLRAAHAPAASLTLEGVLSAVLEQSRLLATSELAIIYLYRRSDRRALCRASGDAGPEALALRDLVSESPRVRHALLTTPSPITPEALACRVFGMPSNVMGFASFCVGRIPAPKGSIGFLLVASRSPTGHSTYDLEALQAFLARAALAIQNAQLYEQLEAQVEELRTMHNQVVRSERLAVLGELAAKVAHEINNPLTSIHMYNSLLLEEPASPEEQRQLAASVQEQVERAKRVVRDILDYSRPSPPSLEIVGLNATVEQGLRLVRHAAAAAHVELIEDYAASLPPIRVDVSQMVQVYTNVTLNAIQAMQRDGKLIVSTGMEGDQLFVRFEDTGCGIPAEQLEHIFEPFFTTKAASEGTGLGLAVCRSLVARHRGHITVESEVGKGSTFTVWLPPAHAEEGMIARPGIG